MYCDVFTRLESRVCREMRSRFFGEAAKLRSLVSRCHPMLLRWHNFPRCLTCKYSMAECVSWYKPSGTTSVRLRWGFWSKVSQVAQHACYSIDAEYLIWIVPKDPPRRVTSAWGRNSTCHVPQPQSKVVHLRSAMNGITSNSSRHQSTPLELPQVSMGAAGYANDWSMQHISFRNNV